METIINKFEKIPTDIDSYFNIADSIIFDIETTGFTPDNTTLYLIGCAYYKSNQWNIIQWFNNDGASEKEILVSFFDFVKSYHTLISYNGDGFDIRYIKRKLIVYNLDYSFENISSVDLYKKLKFLKNLLHLDNLKQRTLESLLSINRLDKYSGKDLIKIYNEYQKDKNEKKRILLLQHNYEDIEGLLSCTILLAYNKLIDGFFYISNMSVKNNMLIFSIMLENYIPKRIVVTHDNISLSAYKSEATLKLPIINSTLKFFFDNYKDYYYLPAEDTAVHKSVATYVDKQYRIQAKKDNCYIKKEGFFITQLDCNIITGYKNTYNDQSSYIELVDSFLKNEELLNTYAKAIIKSILIKKAH